MFLAILHLILPPLFHAFDHSISPVLPTSNILSPFLISEDHISTDIVPAPDIIQTFMHASTSSLNHSVSPYIIPSSSINTTPIPILLATSTSLPPHITSPYSHIKLPQSISTVLSTNNLSFCTIIDPINTAHNTSSFASSKNLISNQPNDIHDSFNLSTDQEIYDGKENLYSGEDIQQHFNNKSKKKKKKKKAKNKQQEHSDTDYDNGKDYGIKQLFSIKESQHKDDSIYISTRSRKLNASVKYKTSKKYD